MANRKPTLRAQQSALRSQLDSYVEDSGKLHKALSETHARCLLAIQLVNRQAAGRSMSENDWRELQEVQTVLDKANKVLGETARCSCGRRIVYGQLPRMCEVCQST